MANPGEWTWREASGLAAWTQRLLWASAALAVATAAFAWLRGFGQGMPGTVEMALTAVQFLLFIVTAVVTLRWIYIANANARSLGASDMMVSPGWSVGWYFVPLMNLFMPFVAMRELWKASAKPGDWQMEPTPATIMAWWVLWLAFNIARGVSSGLGIDPVTLAAAEMSLFVSDLAFAGAALLLASIIGRIQAMQGRTLPAAVFA